MLTDRQRRERGRATGHRGEPQRRDLVGAPPDELLTVEAHAARPGADDAGHRADQRGLAGAVRAEERDDLAGVDMQVSADEHRHAVVAHLEVAQDETGAGRRRLRDGGGRGARLVGQGPDAQPAPRGDAPQDEIADVRERAPEPAGQHEQDGEEPRAGGEDLPLRREEVLRPVQVRRADERAGNRPEPADDRHREDLEAGLGLVGPEVEAGLLVHEQGAGERGEEAGEREREQRESPAAHPVGLRGAVVLAHGDDGTAGATPPHPVRHDHREGQPGQAQVVEAGVGIDGDDAEERRPRDPQRGQPVERVTRSEEAAVEQPVRRHERERERGHRQREPATTDRGQADEHREQCPDRTSQHEAERQVPAEPRGDGARHGRADPDERDLAEAHLPGPAGQHDERAADDPEDEDRGGEVQLARRQRDGDRDQHRDDDHREDHLRGPHLREAAQDLRDGPDLAGRLPARHVAFADTTCACPARHEQPDHHDDEQDGVDVRRLVPVPHDRLLDDAEDDGGADDCRQALHASDHPGGERAQQDRRSEHLTDRQADDPGAEEDGQEGEHGREHPHDGLQSPDRDPQRRRSIGALGAGADGDADVAAPEE